MNEDERETPVEGDCMDEISKQKCLAKAMAETFAFKIGETVRAKGSLSSRQSPYSKHSRVECGYHGIVLDRLAQQCHGGIQRQYVVFFHDWGGCPGSTNITLPEVAIERAQPWTEPPEDEPLPDPQGK